MNGHIFLTIIKYITPSPRLPSLPLCPLGKPGLTSQCNLHAHYMYISQQSPRSRPGSWRYVFMHIILKVIYTSEYSIARLPIYIQVYISIHQHSTAQHGTSVSPPPIPIPDVIPIPIPIPNSQPHQNYPAPIIQLLLHYTSSHAQAFQYIIEFHKRVILPD